MTKAVEKRVNEHDGRCIYVVSRKDSDTLKVPVKAVNENISVGCPLVRVRKGK